MARPKAAKVQADPPKEKQLEVKEDLRLTFEVIGDTEETRIGRKSEYTVPANELDFIHVEVEAVEFEKRGGRKKSRPRVVILDGRTWPTWRQYAHKIGFSYRRVLYAPDGAHQDFPVIQTPAELAKEKQINTLKAQLAELGLDIVPTK